MLMRGVTHRFDDMARQERRKSARQVLHILATIIRELISFELIGFGLSGGSPGPNQRQREGAGAFTKPLR